MTYKHLTINALRSPATSGYYVTWHTA